MGLDREHCARCAYGARADRGCGANASALGLDARAPTSARGGGAHRRTDLRRAARGLKKKSSTDAPPPRGRRIKGEREISGQASALMLGGVVLPADGREFKVGGDSHAVCF